MDRSVYECVQTLDRLEEWIARAMAARLVAVDTETSSLDCMLCDLVGVSLALGPNDACYVPLGHGGSDMFAERPEQVDKAAALAALAPLLASDAVVKVFHNGKYDLNVLARNGLAVAPVEDSYCQGCYNKITMNDTSRLMGAQSIIRCGSCQRILYMSQ